MKIGPVRIGPSGALDEEPSWWKNPYPVLIGFPLAAMLGLICPFFQILFFFPVNFLCVPLGFLLGVLAASRIERSAVPHQRLAYEALPLVFGIELLAVTVLGIFQTTESTWPLFWYLFVFVWIAWGLAQTVPTVRAWADWMQSRERESHST